MKKFNIIGVVLWLVSLLDTTTAEIKIISYNIKSDYEETRENSRERLKIIEDILIQENSDIICLQELSENQIKTIKNISLGSLYNSFLRSRDIYNKDEALAILFKKDNFRLLDSGEFWLSSLPDLRGSKFRDMEFPRVVIWTLLEKHERSQTFTILVINLHLDSLGHESRTDSLAVVIKKISKIMEGHPIRTVIIAGDFNEIPEKLKFPSNLLRKNFRSKLYLNILNRFYTTFHDYSKVRTGMILDYIFILDIKNTNRKIYNINNLYSLKIIQNEKIRKASDHFPVRAIYK